MIDPIILKELSRRSPCTVKCPQDLFYYTSYYNRLLRTSDNNISPPISGHYTHISEEEKSWDTFNFPPFQYYINDIGFRESYPNTEETNILSFFGCSFTFGFGLPTRHTFYKKVAGDLPFLNLADPSATTQKISLIFSAASNIWKIKTAIIILPPWSRFSYVDKVNNFISIVASDSPYPSNEIENIRKALLTNFSDQHMYSCVRNSLTLIVNSAKLKNIDLILGSWDEETIEIIEACTGYKGPFWDWKFMDKGRDGRHPGIESNKVYADLIKTYLQNRQFVL